MVTVKILKHQYDDNVYPIVAAYQAQSVGEAKVAMRVLDKLEEKGVQKLAATQGIKDAYPLFELASDCAQFDFEDAEAAMLKQAIERFLPQLGMRFTRTLVPLVDALTPTQEAS